MMTIKQKSSLKRSILFFALLASVIITGCTEQKGPVNGIGLQLYSVRDDMAANPDSTLQLLAPVGYDFVEAAGYGDGKFYNMEPEIFRQKVEDNGMIFLGSHCGLAVPDSADWEEALAWWDTCIAAHKKAGVKYLVQPFMDSVGYQTIEGVQRYCDYFNAVGEKCKEAGIEFGYHNHDREFGQIDGQVIYDYMLENTDPEKVSFQLDLYWINEGGADAIGYFEKYPGRFFSYHIKDEKELGESGKMDFQPAFDMAEKAGARYFVVEVERYNMTPIESVAASYDYLKKIGFIQ